MKLIYAPEGSEPETFDFGYWKFRSKDEAEVLERHLGMSWGEIKTQGLAGHVGVLRHLLWVLQKRTHPTLKLIDVDPYAGELKLDMDVEDMRRLRGDVNDMTADPEQKQSILDGLDEQIAVKIAALAEAGEVVPKGPPVNEDEPI